MTYDHSPVTQAYWIHPRPPVPTVSAHAAPNTSRNRIIPVLKGLYRYKGFVTVRTRCRAPWNYENHPEFERVEVSSCFPSAQLQTRVKVIDLMVLTANTKGIPATFIVTLVICHQFDLDVSIVPGPPSVGLTCSLLSSGGVISPAVASSTSTHRGGLSSETSNEKYQMDRLSAELTSSELQ
ncbi:hypothetical protein L210DRAFT_3626875 [Boletus edulis BED1]|uniref:Uncharacterized protein n=1 Tax=Boletus edulis BED1 TaxID=1328754 RepID=A0AAD4C5W1_BOLED|nr:hypothetical protein L210DRAFT_3626875 [Boletus edulis BED1]